MITTEIDILDVVTLSQEMIDEITLAAKYDLERKVIGIFPDDFDLENYHYSFELICRVSIGERKKRKIKNE